MRRKLTSIAAVSRKPLKKVAACANGFTRQLHSLALFLCIVRQVAAFNPSVTAEHFPAGQRLLARPPCGAGRHMHAMLAVDASKDAVQSFLEKEVSKFTNILGRTQDLGTAAIETDDGIVLVTGGASGLGNDFVKSVFGNVAEKCKYFQEGGDLTSEEKVDALLSEVNRVYAEKPIVGLAHFGQGQSDVHADLGNSAMAGAAIVDSELRSFILLVGRLVPDMRKLGTQCRIVTFSNGHSQMSPSSWLPGTGMKALVMGFVEQYTEALAEELHESNIIVYGIRMPVAGASEPNFAKLQGIWEKPALEAHGRILDMSADPLLDGQGGNVIGPSIDSRWALRAAAGQTADYPNRYLPEAYAELAEALGFESHNLVWCHGASDVIIRVSAVAAARTLDSAGSDSALTNNSQLRKALTQQPSWSNAESLMKSGGLNTIAYAPYADPWASSENRERFWQDLETLVETDPPALVYLVDPHFPVGYKTPDLSVRLTRLLEKAKGKALFAVDQTYLGFTGRTEDDKACEALALSRNDLVLMRSLSKVEGLAALRLGYVIASPLTATDLRCSLPFSGHLYVSELALGGALAALRGKAAARHRKSVLEFYESEKEWFGNQLRSVGLHVSPSDVGIFFPVQGPRKLMMAAMKAGAVFQEFEYPRNDTGRTVGSGEEQLHAAALVCRRATNMATVEAVRKAFENEAKRQAPVGEDFMKKIQSWTR